MSKIDSYSVKLWGNTQRVKMNGKCSLYLRVIINRDKFEIPLGLDWPKKLIDNSSGVIKPPVKNDPDWQDNLLIIQNYAVKVNDIFKIYRISDLPLSMDQFKRELKTYDKRGCFIAFMNLKINERFDEGRKGAEIHVQTYRNHRAASITLSKMVKQQKLPFIQINEKFFDNYKRFCRRTFSHNEETIRSRIAIFKRYLRAARKDGIHIDYNVLDYIIGERSKRLVWLNNNEIVMMMNQLDNPANSTCELICLRSFLFSCFTGLRASDLERANHNWITINNDLDFVMLKNSRNRPKRLILPLSEIAKSFITNYNGLFFPVDKVTMNEKIKIMAKRAEVNKHLTMHVGRHTFGSSYIENGGEVAVLQQLMGHSRIKDTMIYVHIHEHKKRTQIDEVHGNFLNFKNELLLS